MFYDLVDPFRVSGRDPRRRTGTSSMRHVTARSGIANQVSGSQTQCGWRSRQFSFVPMSAIQVGIWNGYTNSAVNGVETGSGGIMTSWLSLEWPKGNFTRLTYNNGADNGAIANNALGFCDIVPLPFTIPPFSPYRLAGMMTFAGAGRVISHTFANSIDRAWGDEFAGGTSGIVDNTMNSTPYTGAGTNSQGFIPPLVLGYSDCAVWAGVGDSIVAGVNDTFADPAGGKGLFGRSMAKFGPYLNFGCPGDRAQWAVSNYTRRLAMLQAGGMTRAILEYGTNDLYSGGRTTAELLADRATIRGLLNVPTYDTTLLPNTDSPDLYVTAANQTAKGGNATAAARRLAFNQALRAGGIASMAGLVDLAGRVETSTANERTPTQDGGVWLPAMMQGGDGLHPPTVALREMEPLVDSLLMSVS